MPFSILFKSKGKPEESGTPRHLSTWMSTLESTALEQVPLHNLFIPGSHDSGAYRLYPKLGFSMDRPDLQRNWLLNAFQLITYPLIARYSVTQRLSIYEQLESGIRYLDIRVAIRPEDGHFYICHNFYGPRLEEVLEQVAKFAAKYPKEVLILDFQHVHNFRTEADHRRLYELLIVTYRDKLVITGERTHSLLSLWSAGEQVFVFYRNAFQDQCPKFLWSTDHLPNPWPNTRDPRELRLFLETNIVNRPVGKLFVTQGVLTPNTGYVVRNLFGSLESKLTIKANNLLYQLIVGDRCGGGGGAKEATHTEEEQKLVLAGGPDQTVGPNIVMFDFVDWKRFVLAHSIVQLNRSLLISQNANLELNGELNLEPNCESNSEPNREPNHEVFLE